MAVPALSDTSFYFVPVGFEAAAMGTRRLQGGQLAQGLKLSGSPHCLCSKCEDVAWGL